MPSSLASVLLVFALVLAVAGFGIGAIIVGALGCLVEIAFFIYAGMVD